MYIFGQFIHYTFEYKKTCNYITKVNMEFNTTKTFLNYFLSMLIHSGIYKIVLTLNNMKSEMKINIVYLYLYLSTAVKRFMLVGQDR